MTIVTTNDLLKIIYAIRKTRSSLKSLILTPGINFIRRIKKLYEIPFIIHVDTNIDMNKDEGIELRNKINQEGIITHISNESTRFR